VFGFGGFQFGDEGGLFVLEVGAVLLGCVFRGALLFGVAFGGSAEVAGEEFTPVGAEDALADHGEDRGQEGLFADADAGRVFGRGTLGRSMSSAAGDVQKSV